VLSAADRGSAVAGMGEALQRFIASRKDIAAVIGIGGGGGTSIVTAGMRALPIGMPKLMVSTLASGNVAPYVDVSDIAMMASITDIAGLNSISRVVLANAAYAIAGMARAVVPQVDTKPTIGLTMFGVTTPAVTQAVEALRADYDCLVFHATGTGGRAMEKLVDSALLVGVIDVTTTEICDLLFEGVLSAGPDRLGAIARTRIPYVGSVGALDMVNFHAIDSVPEKYRRRNLYRHNPQVTLMRTTADENRTMGAWIAERLNRCQGEVRFLIPEKGVSAIDAPASPFTIRTPTPPSSKRSRLGSSGPKGGSWSGCRSTSTTENSPPCWCRTFVRSQPEGAPHAAHRAEQNSRQVSRHGAPPRADRRRRGGHRPFGEMRGGGRHRPHHHL
jgi:uncharacterized protein (UPF0261 family)